MVEVSSILLSSELRRRYLINLIKNSLDELLLHKYLKVVSYKGEINLVIKPPFIYIIRKSNLFLRKKKN